MEKCFLEVYNRLLSRQQNTFLPEFHNMIQAIIFYSAAGTASSETQLSFELY